MTFFLFSFFPLSITLIAPSLHSPHCPSYDVLPVQPPLPVRIQPRHIVVHRIGIPCTPTPHHSPPQKPILQCQPLLPPHLWSTATRFVSSDPREPEGGGGRIRVEQRHSRVPYLNYSVHDRYAASLHPPMQAARDFPRPTCYRNEQPFTEAANEIIHPFQS